MEREPLHIIFSRNLKDAYNYRYQPRQLTGDLLKTFVEEEILDAFGLGKGDKMKIIFKTMMTKEDIEEVIKFFDTVGEICKIYDNNNIIHKTIPISEVIETFFK